jgi:transposase InsO family protein
MDLVGPACVCSAGRKWYVLVIVDEYSRYAWVFFLADKGETFGFVPDLILRLKNERNGDVVRAIRSDNCSEFTKSRLETFCHDLGLEHQFSSPYVACQNGVVERKNHSLCEMARTMLDEHRTPRRYWTEVVITACHVGNWIFLRDFLNKTCYELMHGRAPRVSHFRAFGCRCFILKKGRLDKFESRPPMGFSWVMIVILEDEEDDVGEDDGDDGEAPATHVPSTSTTTTTMQDGPSPTPPTIQQDQVEAAVVLYLLYSFCMDFWYC